MAIQENATVEKRLRRLEATRVSLGVAVIVSVVALVLAGVEAFTEQRDASLAMRLPLLIALILLCSFARCAKAIAATKSTARR